MEISQELVERIYQNCLAQSHALAKSMAKEIQRGIKDKGHKVNPSGITMKEGTITFNTLRVQRGNIGGGTIETKTDSAFKYLDSNVSKTATGAVIETRLPNYAYFVEYGRKPGKRPPIKPIREWCKVQGLDTERMPYAMANTIAKKGTTGTPYLYLLDRFQRNISSLAKGWVVDFLNARYNDTTYLGTELPRKIDIKL